MLNNTEEMEVLLRGLGILQTEANLSNESADDTDASDSGVRDAISHLLPPFEKFAKTKAKFKHSNKDADLSYDEGALPGICVIFNQQAFHSTMHLQERPHSTEKKVKLHKLFEEVLHFDVYSFDNLTKSQILQELMNIKTNQNLAEMRCLVVVIMTYGHAKCVCASDQDFPIDWLIQPFTGDNCRALLGKPKFIIVQASDKMFLSTPRLKLEKMDEIKLPIHPVEADILLALSTLDVHPNKEQQSDFLDFMADVFREHHPSADVLQMLTYVNRLVWENNPITNSTVIVSHLRRRFHFSFNKSQ